MSDKLYFINIRPCFATHAKSWISDVDCVERSSQNLTPLALTVKRVRESIQGQQIQILLRPRERSQFL
jgi:hypothetical protein